MTHLSSIYLYLQMIKQMWPYICEYVKGVLKTSVEGSVNTSLPASLQPFRFEKIDLGDAVSCSLINYRCYQMLIVIKLIYHVADQH